MPAIPTPDGASGTTDLVRRLSVAEIVSVYEREEAKVRQAFALLASAEDSLNATFSLGEHRSISIHDSYNRTLNFADVDSCLESLRRNVWSTLVDRLELRRMMSIRAWEELDEKIRRGEVPEINHATVSAMVHQFESQLPQMLEEAVVEVFNFLRPRQSEFKTNSEFEIGRKVIMTWAVSRKWSGAGFEVDYRYQPELTALENVFTALDGKGSITKTHYSALSNAIKASTDGRGETEYFRFKCFKKHTLHIEFLRPDLVKRLNQIAGGMRLRGGRAAA